MQYISGFARRASAYALATLLAYGAAEYLFQREAEAWGKSDKKIILIEKPKFVIERTPHTINIPLPRGGSKVFEHYRIPGCTPIRSHVVNSPFETFKYACWR